MKYISILLFLMVLPMGSMYAQKKLQKSPGQYHGDMDFPISWKRYYSYAEWTQIMKDIQKKYPHLADISCIGESRMGRKQYLMTLTAKDKGKASEKPAMWVDGAVHGNEVNGITCSLYLMWYLLTRYDYDSYVYDLMNNTTFYILPGLNVDANDSYVSHPNTPNNPREPFRPEDNDGDGLYDEDRTEDVDGDGELSVMYKEDTEGMYKLSFDKKRFVPVEKDEDLVLRFKRIGGEGFDNDGDGLLNEDDIGGPDPNRNYPWDWNINAGNPYPLSEPCTRNAFEFMLDHHNIMASFHYHNIGRLIMFQAPQAVKAKESTDRYAQYRAQAQKRRFEEMKKENKYLQFFDRTVAPDMQHDMDVQTDIVSVGARILKNYRPTMAGGIGQAPASSYNMLGAYSYLIELWGSPSYDIDENDDGDISDEEYQHWIDYDLTGAGWIDPHKVMHPDLGEIWIGGSPRKHIRRTPPEQYIEMEAEKNARFVMYCASQFPKVEIAELNVRPIADGLFYLDVRVENKKTYPTVSDQSLKLGRVDKDQLILDYSDCLELLELNEKAGFVTDDFSRINVKAGEGKTTNFRLKGKESLVYRYLFRMNKDKSKIKVSLKSKYGGEDFKEITVKK